MSHKGIGGSPETNKNKSNQQPAKKSKTSLINKLFKRKKPTKSTVTSSSSTDSESDGQSTHLRFFSKRKSKRKSSGVKNVTEKFDHVVLSPERKVQTISENTSPYQIRHTNTRIEYENNTIRPNDGNQTREHLYINTTDVKPWLWQNNENIQHLPNHDATRSSANEEEQHMRRLKISPQRRKTNEGILKNSNDISSSVKKSNSGRGLRKDLPLKDSSSYPNRYNSNQINANSKPFYHVNVGLKAENSRMHYKSDDNISRTYENSSVFDHLNGNMSSPSARRSHKHLSDDDNVSLRRRNSRTESNSSSENVNSNSLSRRSRAARNERYYKRLSRDHEVEKLALPLSPKNKHKSLQQSKSLPMNSPNQLMKINYAPRYPNFQKINQPYYNMNSTYPLPQSAGNSSRVSSASSLNRSVMSYPPQGAAVNSSKILPSHYQTNSLYPQQQNENLSRMSSTSTLSHLNSSNYPTFPPTDMKLVHAIPFKSVSYDCNMNSNSIQPARDLRSMSFDNINQNQFITGRKVPPNPPPRNPNRKTIVIYEAPNSILQCDQKRHSSHQPYESNSESNSFHHSDRSIPRLPYNESYTGERAYLIKQAHPNMNNCASNLSENSIRNERSLYNVQPVHAEDIIQKLPGTCQSNQAYFHHKDKTQIGNNEFHPDSRYTNNDRLNEPNQYNPSTDNQNVQFYSATSKIIPSSPQVPFSQCVYNNGEQLYENSTAIRAHSSQQSKRPSSISTSDSQSHKKSFIDHHYSDPHFLIRNQRLTRSNETLPLDEHFIRMNQVGIPMIEVLSNNLQQVKAPSTKRTFKARPNIEVKDTIRPLSIVLEKSENELDSDKTNITASNIGTFTKCETPKTNERKLNENGLRITREGKNIKGSASNLDDALTELEQIYESLNLNDEDLLDRAERRDLPLCYQINKDQFRETPEVEEINRILGNTNNPNRKPSTRRIAIANKINDDMAVRKYRYQKETPINSTNSETGSYLLTSPTLSPPPFFEDKSASPVTFVDSEPDVTRDDVVYRNTKYVNNLLKVHDPQPFGIPLRPVINSSSTDYLHVIPDSEKYRSTFHSSKTPDVVMDDLAYRNLRKDYNKDFNSLTNFNLIPAFRSDKNSSPLPEKDGYLSNLNSEERFQKKKKRAVRSLSGNLLMRDYGTTDSDLKISDYLGFNGPSNYVRSETTSPEYHDKKSSMLESEFEKLKDRWLSTPSPEDMKRQRSRDGSLLSYIKENSITKRTDNDNIKKADSPIKCPSEEINISSEVEILRRKFVIPVATKKVHTNKTNPFKKMLYDNFDISPEIEAIRKKFVANKEGSENKNKIKSSGNLEKSKEEVGYKNYFKTLKDQFDSNKRANTDTEQSNKSPNSLKKKSDAKKTTKKVDPNKDNPFVSQFENIRNIFSEKNEDEIKEIIKPKKKIKKFRETNNNSFATTNDYYDYKTNMDRNIDSLKKRALSDNGSKSKSENSSEDLSISDTSVLDNKDEKTVTDEIIDLRRSSYEQQFTDEANVMSKEDQLLQKIAKETNETSAQINEKLKQLETTVVQHKAIKLNQFPISLDDDNVLMSNVDPLETSKKEKQSIFKSAQTVSMESEYDNIPKSTYTSNQHQYESDHNEEAPNFDDLSIPQDPNVYEKLDLTNLVRVGEIINKFENGNSLIRSNIEDSNVFSKQISITSEYDNVNFNKSDSAKQMPAVDSRSKEILLKRLDTNKYESEDEYKNNPFVSLTMNNIAPEDVESLASSDNEVAVSEISDEELNSQDLDLINRYFQNGKAVNTIGIKISEIKNLNFESDSSFNSEVQNIFNPQSKPSVDEECTDSEMENLPIDLHVEILETKSISSLDNDSTGEDLVNLDLKSNNKDKYSIELEHTLDTVVNSENISDSMKTLCHSPIDEVVLIEEPSSSIKSKSEFSTTNENIRKVDDIKSNPCHTDLLAITEEPSPNQDIIECEKENVRIEEIPEPKVSKSKESNNNDEIVIVSSPELCDGKLLRSKSSGNISQSNGVTKSPLREETSTDWKTSHTAQRKTSNSFGKCCSSSSSSNLDLCSSDASSKSPNPCRDLTPVRRRRSLPESPVKSISLTNMCASLTRPEGTSYNLIAMIFVMLALYIAYARGLHIVTLLAFISLACIFLS